jgi:hypothetical protein
MRRQTQKLKAIWMQLDHILDIFGYCNVLIVYLPYKYLKFQFLFPFISLNYFYFILFLLVLFQMHIALLRGLGEFSSHVWLNTANPSPTWKKSPA